MKKLLQRIALGLAMGCTAFVFVGFAVCVINNTGIPFSDSDSGFVKLACCSMLISVGFTAPSVVYDCPRLSRSIQVLLHVSIGCIVFGIVSFGMGWLPALRNDAGQRAASVASAVVFVLVSVATTAIIWLCFYLHDRAEAKKINEQIRKTMRQPKDLGEE